MTKKYSQTSIETYRKVLWHEVLRRKEFMSEEDAMLSVQMSIARIHQKSALLNRIEDGLPVFKIPPPCAYAYPAYRLFDANRPDETMLKSCLMDDLVIDGKSSLVGDSTLPHLIIHQGIWYVLEKINEHHYLVSTRGCEKSGIRWDLKFETYGLDETEMVHVAGFSRERGRVRTYSQLLEDTQQKILQQEQSIALFLLPDSEAGKPDLLPDSEALSLARQRKNAIQGDQHRLYGDVYAKHQIKHRQEAGLPWLLTDQEIDTQVNELMKKMMDPHNIVGVGSYSVGDNDQLMINGWRLHLNLDSGVTIEGLHLPVDTLESPPVNFLK